MTNKLFYISLPMDASASANVLTALATCLAVIVTFLGIFAALWQIRVLQKQLKFDALLRGYDFSRELHSLGFADPRIWKTFTCSPSSLSDEDSQIHRRTTQLFLNLMLLEWQAKSHGYYSKSVWQAKRKDMVSLVHKPGFSEFWVRYCGFYPTDFGKFVDDLMKTECPAIPPYPSTSNVVSGNILAQNKESAQPQKATSNILPKGEATEGDPKC
jgi:hypothetical protein